MSGGHSHSHHHQHDAQADFSRAFAIGIGLNVGFVLLEAVFGFAANSMSLLADAGHNLSDVLGLVVAWAGGRMARTGSSPRFTYGLKKASILAALVNSLFLLIAVGAIGAEAIRRLFHPSATEGGVVMAVAAVGILVNGATALLFARGHNDINIRGAFLHMAADAAVSVGVVIAGLVILFTGWLWLDPAVSLLIVAVIAWSTWGLLRDSLKLSVAAVPPGIEPGAVRAFLLGRPGVLAVHDLHIWPMSTTEVALTAHLVMPDGAPGDDFLFGLTHDLRERHGIDHPTFQIERDATHCPLAPEHVV